MSSADCHESVGRRTPLPRPIPSPCPLLLPTTDTTHNTENSALDDPANEPFLRDLNRGYVILSSLLTISRSLCACCCVVRHAVSRLGRTKGVAAFKGECRRSTPFTHTNHHHHQAGAAGAGAGRADGRAGTFVCVACSPFAYHVSSTSTDPQRGMLCDPSPHHSNNTPPPN